ncbi:hypothetical protein TUBRATIS_16930 [Tubulinosema ratisbonensis]|uniref:Uncharacterized protein n=1 Tax=Tubulinosema ratisbonensis TaxID=291195 RepID=A0A437ALA0_9MICR|nr:hypothetical protein TUBRATIS_16930 [Tubulinosema ratisbonensis]
MGFVKKDHIGIVNRTNLEDNVTIHIKNKEKSLNPQFAIFVDDFMVCSKAKNHVDLCTGSSDDFYFWEIFYVDKNGYMIVIRRNGNLCLTYNEKNNTDLYLKKCSLKNKYQFWDINKVERDSGFNLPENKRAIEQPIASNLVNLLYKNLKSALNSLT